jgi:hypothetical protein
VHCFINKRHILLGIIALTISSQSVVYCQQYPKKDKRRTDPAFDTVKITKPEDLSYVPQYAGKGTVFVNGDKLATSQNGSRCIMMRFYAKELPEDVINWYRGALTQYGWVIDARQTKSTFITGLKNKEGLRITVDAQAIAERAPDGQPYRSRFLIRFVEGKPLNTDS